MAIRNIKTRKIYQPPSFDGIKDEEARRFCQQLSDSLIQTVQQIYDDITFLCGAFGFSASKNAVNQTVAQASDVKLTFTTEDYDQNSDYDAANSRFVPQFSGKYLVVGSVRFTASEDQISYEAKIFKNGALYKTFMVRASGTGAISVPFAAIVDATADGDYFEIYVNHGSAASKDVDGTVSRTFFQGMRIAGK